MSRRMYMYIVLSPHCWFLLINVFLRLIIGVEATHFVGEDVIIRSVDTEAASYGASNVVQYVLFHDDMGVFSYNQARATCKAIGGDLAKVETVEKRNWINSLGQDPKLVNGDLWLGISEKVSGNPMWAADCKSADPALISGSTWATDKRCFLHTSSDDTFQFGRKSCTGNYAILCQTYTTVITANCNVHPTYVNSEIPDDDCDLTTSTTTTSVSSTTTATASTSTMIPASISTTDVTVTTAQTTSTTPATAPVTTAIPTPTTTTTSTSTTTSTTSTTPTTVTASTQTTNTTPTSKISTTSSTTTSTSTVPTTTTTQATTIITNTTTTTVPAGNCGDCFCALAVNFTIQEAQAIANQISKNLTVDAKSTSAHRRKRESAEDHRPSAKAIGFVGIMFILIPFGFVILTDLRTMFSGVRNIRNVYRV